MYTVGEVSVREFTAPDPQKNMFSPAKRACDAKYNRLLQGRRFSVLAVKKGGKVTGRLLLVDGENDAWFSLLWLAMDPEGAQQLFHEARRTARLWGKDRLVGPGSPDGCGFGIGVRLPGAGHDSAPWHPCNPGYYSDLLEGCGFRRIHELAELQRDLLPGENPFAGIGPWAEKRGWKAEMHPLSEKICRVMWKCSEDGRDYEDYARIVGRIAEKADAKICIEEKDGQSVGYAVTVREKDALRILHMQIIPVMRRTPAAALMLCRITENAKGRLRVSTIDLENKASLNMAINAKMREIARYGVYAIET